jgi:phage terminase large subunit
VTEAAPYIIAELSEDQDGGFSPRGAVKQLWKSRDFETVVSGPAETGKTWGCLQYADALLWKYPGAQGVICRKKYSYLIGSAVRTFKRVLGADTPIKAYGGEKPEWFDYPNGSRMWVAGMDNPGRALSSERDFIYCNQAEELAVEDWETLSTRCTGRGAVMPYTRLFGDCNPMSPRHWIKGRQSAGRLRLLESRHRDNPTLFTEGGQITEQGKRTLGILSDLTGARRLRLLEGKWASNEGLVYETFDAATHVIPAPALAFRRYVAGVDWGYRDPGVIELFGIDGDGRMYRVREVYQTGKTIDWWVERAVNLNAEVGGSVEAFVCDPAEPAYIEAFQNAGLSVVEGFNDILPGIGAVEQRLKVQGDGRARLYLVDDANREPDAELQQTKKSTGLIDEMDGYSWPVTPDGKPNKEVPADKDNHAQDATRYAVAYVDGLGNQPVELETDFFFVKAHS